jgi:hypothetical protein
MLDPGQSSASRITNPSLNLSPSPTAASIGDQKAPQSRITVMTRFNRFAFSPSRIGHLTLPVCAGLALLAAPAVEAREGEGRIAACIRQVAHGQPWLEKTLWGLRDQEAGWLGAAVRNTNGSHDLGPLQINTWWVPKIAELVGRSQADVRTWLMHDPCFNAGAARWIFLSALKDTGDFWKAVGVYHSPTGWRQRRYASSVAHHLERRFGRDIFAEPVTPISSMPERFSAVGRGEAEEPTVRVLGFGVVQTPSS